MLCFLVGSGLIPEHSKHLYSCDALYDMVPRTRTCGQGLWPRCCTFMYFCAWLELKYHDQWHMPQLRLLHFVCWYLYVWTVWKLEFDGYRRPGVWAQWVHEFVWWKRVKDIMVLSTYEIGHIGQNHSGTFLSKEGVRKYLWVLQMFME